MEEDEAQEAAARLLQALAAEEDQRRAWGDEPLGAAEDAVMNDLQDAKEDLQEDDLQYVYGSPESDYSEVRTRR